MLSDLAPGLSHNLVLTAALLVACVLVLWLISIPLKNMSIIDIFWGPGFGLVAVATYLNTQGIGVEPRKLLITALTLVWALRLGSYIFWRNHGKGEDPRYAELFRNNAAGSVHWRSLTQVFLVQGVLVWIISMPLQITQFYIRPEHLGVPAKLGALLWAVGFFFETLGDWQLARFMGKPKNKGKIMNGGLWRYTRHPNYFGNSCLWWGLFLIACDNRIGLFTVFSPALMTYLIVKVSGKRLLEKRMSNRGAQYAEYLATTSGFFPLPPKKPISKSRS